MNKLVLAGALFLSISIPAFAAAPEPPTLAALDAEIHGLTLQLEEAQAEIQSLKERLREIEDRLGDSFGSSSPFNTIERRLEELERDSRR